MDLPPPPPPLFRHHHDNLRYENVLRPPDFIPPPPYPHRLPPLPPQSHIHLPPPPPLPSIRRMSPPPIPTRFPLSPPRYPVIDRSHHYSFDPQPKPYFHPTLPPPPPPPPRENVPLRIVHDYPKRNPVFEDVIFPRGRIDNMRELPENWGRDSLLGGTEVHNIDAGGHDKYRDVISERFEFYRNRGDGGSWDSGISDWGSDSESRRVYDERRWDSGVDDRSCSLNRERDYDARRWNSVMDERSRDLYREHDCDEMRWDSGMNERSRDLYREHDCGEMRWDSVMNERSPDLYGKGNFGERRWDSGIKNQGCELYYQLDDEERTLPNRSAGVLSRLGNRQPEFSEDGPSLGGVLSRLGHRQPDIAGNVLSPGGVLSRLGNRQPELGEVDLSLGRRLGTRAHNGMFYRSDKKKRLQKKNALHRTQLSKVRSRNTGGFKSLHFAEDSSGGNFKGDEKGYGKIQTKMEGKRVRENSPVELAISFKSNALVAKAIQVPSHPAVGSRAKSKLVKKRLGCYVPASKTDVVSELQSDSQGTSTGHQDEAAVSGSGSETLSSTRDLGENVLKNAHMEVLNPKGLTMVSPEETHSTWLMKRKRVTEQLFLEANLRMEKDSHDISVDACNSVVTKLKKKKCSLYTAPDSSFVSDNAITKCSGRAEGLVTTSNDGDRVCQLRADAVAYHVHDNFLPNGSTGYEDSLGSNQHVISVNEYVHDWVGDASKLSVSGEAGLLESSFTEGPSEDIVYIKDHDTGGAAGSQETRIPEVENYFLETHELISLRKSDCAVLQTTEDAIVSDVEPKDADSEDFLPNQGSKPQVMIDANDFRSLEATAATDFSDVAFDVSASSRVLSANDKETLLEFDISFPNNVETYLSYNIDSVEGFPKVISDKETSLSVDNSSPKVISDRGICLIIDNSSKVIRKRKNRGDQLSLSGRNADLNVGIIRSIDGEVIRDLAKGIVPGIDGNNFSKKDSNKEDTSLKEGPSGREDSLQEFDCNANGSFLSYQKKQKLSSPRSSLSTLSEDDTIADGLSMHSTRPSEYGAEQSEGTSSTSTTINQCGFTDVEGEVGVHDLYVVNVVDDKKSHEDDASGISCSNRNGLSASNSGDDHSGSGFDMQSCITSPEELHVYSSLTFSGNAKASACLSDNEVISRSDPRKDTSRVSKKLYPVHGKQTWSKNQHPSAITKAFPAKYPLSSSNTRKLYASHVTKSRTWCRTGNSTIPVAEPKLQPSPAQTSGTNAVTSMQSSYVRKGNSLVRKSSLSDDTSPGFHGFSSSVYPLSSCTNTMKNNMETDNKTGDADAPALKRTGKTSTSEMTKVLRENHIGNSFRGSPCNLEEPLPVRNPHNNGCPSKALDAMEERTKSSPVLECHADSVINSDSQSTFGEGNSEKKIVYVKRRSYQLVATSNSNDTSTSKVDNNQSQLSDGYYKSRENQLVRASPESHIKIGNVAANVPRLVPHSIISRTSARKQSGFSKTCRYSKFSFVWKLHDTQSSEKHKNSLVPRKVVPYLRTHKRTAYWRSLVLGIKPSLSNISQKLLVSRKRGAIYTRSSHGYSLKMSKVLSVGGASLKWSKSIERNSKKANEEATRAVAAAEKRKKEEKGAVPIASKTRNHVSRKLVPNVKLRPGERIFRIGSERYKMDVTRRTLHRIAEKESSSSVALQSENNVKKSYIPRRLLIGNEEYVRIGNGNQLVRDPKKRTRVLASEKVRWSLRTARLRLAKKRKYCQFFTRFGKCNKDDGKCPYIHDPSKIVVCTKFLTGSCTNINCKLTHKVIPERMQDCSYFLKGSCSNDNCPYRHVQINPDSTVCESFLRGYCADGNECRKKHTYVCPDYEATGVCPQASTCKLHHPKKKAEKNPESEQRIVRGRYFDGGLIEVADCSSAAPTEKLSSEGKDDIVVHEGKFPDYISLDVSEDERETLPEAWIDDLGEEVR